MTPSVDWKGRPVPPSRLQALLRDDPATRGYGAAHGPRVPKSLATSFEEYVRARSGVTCSRPEEVVAFLRGCRYARDAEAFGREEVWLHPEDFERLRVGDCEDHALWAWAQLVRAGRDARFTAGIHQARGHAWVTIFDGASVTVCETTARKSGRYLVDPRGAYDPWWSVSGEVRFFWHRAGADAIISRTKTGRRTP